MRLGRSRGLRKEQGYDHQDDVPGATLEAGRRGAKLEKILAHAPKHTGSGGAFQCARRLLITL